MSHYTWPGNTEYPHIEGEPLDRTFHIEKAVTWHLGGKKIRGRISSFTQTGRVYVRVDGVKHPELVPPSELRWGWA